MNSSLTLRRAPNRRSFLTALGTGAASALLAQIPSRVLAQSTTTSSGGYLASTDTTSDLLFMSAVKHAQLIREKKISSVDLVKACLARIDKVNPQLNAVVTLCAERALAEAAEADALLAKGTIKGPLHGVPMTIKDSFDTAGVLSTGGTLGRKGFVASKDATVVARARAAGAILLGKSNTPEFTLGGGAKGTVNLIFGTTKNPYNLAYQPAGSSGGAGAIVAAGGSSFDIGSDYGGSIRGPCHVCGIAGIKPTTGLVPRTGHIVDFGGPFDAYQETGPMARRIEDIIVLMQVLSGPDYLDAAMAPIPFGDPFAVDVKKLRVAYFTTTGELDPTPEIQAAVKTCAGFLKDLGAQVTEDRPPKIKEIGQVRSQLSSADGRAHIKRLVAKAGTTVTSPGLRLDGDPVTPDKFTDLYEQLDAMRSEMLAWFENYDIILCPPSATPAAPINAEKVTPGVWTYTSVFNTTGWPGAIVRAGLAPDNLPIGIQVVAQPFMDHNALAVARFLEGKTGGFQKPAI
jgi:amidase